MYLLSKRPDFLLKFCQQRPQNPFTRFKDWEGSPCATNPNLRDALTIFQALHPFDFLRTQCLHEKAGVKTMVLEVFEESLNRDAITPGVVGPDIFRGRNNENEGNRSIFTFGIL